MTSENYILTTIQNELKAPKSKYNSFGNYMYRSAEDIQQAVKPLLEKYHAQLYMDEEVQQVGDRVYLKEMCHYKDSQQEVITHGWAREPQNKKKQDESQITGSASSYATKYALSKLFLIDDTTDADSEPHSTTTNSRKSSYQNRQATKQAKTKQLSNDELKHYSVTVQGKSYKVIDIFKQAVGGNKKSQVFLKKLIQSSGQSKQVVDELSKLYKSLEKAKPVAKPEPAKETSEPDFSNPVDPFSQIN